MLPNDKYAQQEEDEELIQVEPDGSEDPGSELDRDATVPLLNPDQITKTDH
jgi:hypothetical protein